MSKYPFLNTVLELHRRDNVDQFLSIWHWSMLSKSYLLRYANGQVKNFFYELLFN
jgi:hypothetical protein